MLAVKRLKFISIFETFKAAIHFWGSYSQWPWLCCHIRFLTVSGANSFLPQNPRFISFYLTLSLTIQCSEDFYSPIKMAWIKRFKRWIGTVSSFRRSSTPEIHLNVHYNVIYSYSSRFFCLLRRLCMTSPAGFHCSFAQNRSDVSKTFNKTQSRVVCISIKWCYAIKAGVSPLVIAFTEYSF